MRQTTFLRRALLALGVVGIAAAAPADVAKAQTYVCPYGYYYVRGYGCAPLSYYYAPPTYAVPDFGFNFFYGWGGGHRYGGRSYHPSHPGGGHSGGGHPGGGGHRHR